MQKRFFMDIIVLAALVGSGYGVKSSISTNVQ
jgi:hypothetical protein